MTTPVDVPVPTIIRDNVLIEPDAVRILDRRVFPFEKSWVTCHDHEEVAKATAACCPGGASPREDADPTCAPSGAAPALRLAQSWTAQWPSRNSK